MRNKCFFRLFSHLKRNENEIKRKQSEKTFISFCIEAKRKDRKRNKVKRKTFGSETKRKYALLISLWSEAKNSKRNEAKRSEKKLFFFHVSVRNACKMDLVSLRFALKQNRRTLDRNNLIIAKIKTFS
jgi:hypothetical protein